MPYIVTTRSAAAPPNQQHGVRAKILSSHTVATLDDAQHDVDLLIEEHGGSIDEHDDIAENGGSIGPLPDGTVIEVERTI